LDQEIVVQEDDQWPEKSRENRVKENGKTWIKEWIDENYDKERRRGGILTTGNQIRKQVKINNRNRKKNMQPMKNGYEEISKNKERLNNIWKKTADKTE
jgi:hypothetical protein